MASFWVRKPKSSSGRHRLTTAALATPEMAIPATTTTPRRHDWVTMSRWCNSSVTATTTPKPPPCLTRPRVPRSEEHTSELQSLMRISYAVFCLKKKNHLHHMYNTTLIIHLISSTLYYAQLYPSITFNYTSTTTHNNTQYVQ